MSEENKEVEELALSLAYAMNEGVSDRQRGYARYLINVLGYRKSPAGMVALDENKAYKLWFNGKRPPMDSWVAGYLKDLCSTFSIPAQGVKWPKKRKCTCPPLIYCECGYRKYNKCLEEFKRLNPNLIERVE